MYTEGSVIRTRLRPPRPARRALNRPRVLAHLRQALDHRLTLVQAGAGYGKSTALASLAEEPGLTLAWYTVDEEDSTPLAVLAHLIHAFYLPLADLPHTPLALIESWGLADPPESISGPLDALLNEIDASDCGPLLLVIDDAHLLEKVPGALPLIERLLRLAPPQLHLLLAGRGPLPLTSLPILRVRGESLEIGEAELAFTDEEIAAFFEYGYGLRLDAEDLALIAAQTEGWAIALQLLAGGGANGGSALPDLLRRFSGMKEDLFGYLAQEVLAVQPEPVQRFMRISAVLRELDPDLCDCLRDREDSSIVLDLLQEGGLFVVPLDGASRRYHHLFREFLLARLSPEERRGAHLRAAACLRARGELEEAISQLLQGGQPEQAAPLIEQVGRAMVAGGRHESLAAWLDALPADVLAAQPSLLIYLGDVARLQSRFGEALRWYQQAQDRCAAAGDRLAAARALRGQARVYLDTVNPAGAEAPLREALRLSDGQDSREMQADLLDLLAENQLNRGRSDEALDLREQARALREEGPGVDELDVRVMLRSGQIDKALALLNARAQSERDAPVMRPRAHRETLLVLSFIQAMRGEAEAAYRSAVDGAARGQSLGSPFITAVGWMRQGHAWMLRDQPGRMEEARRCFEEAIALADRMQVERLKVEALWGLTRVHAYQGRLAEAREYAAEGIRRGSEAGDEWVLACIRLTMGAALALAGQQAEAARWLTEAGLAFREAGDTFGRCLTLLWFSLLWQAGGDSARLRQSLDDLLRLAQAEGYDYLFLRRSMSGPPDARRVVPLLLFARDQGIQGDYALRLLEALGLARLELHPGYRIKVQTFGALRVWRGEEELSASDWQREKARQMFLWFITHRRNLTDREKLWSLLWPEQMAEAANQSFKVTLNALYNALEPARGRGESAVITRKGSLYGVRPEADLWIDAAAFERAVAEGDALYSSDPLASLTHYREALTLYQGDYLGEFPYEEWWERERTRLREMCLRVADRSARILLHEALWDDVLLVSSRLIEIDPCWEAAYRYAMQAHQQMGNRSQALRTYQRAVEALREELDVEPSEETLALYEAIQGE